MAPPDPANDDNPHPKFGASFHLSLKLPSVFPKAAKATMEKYDKITAKEIREQTGSALFNFTKKHHFGLPSFLPPKTTAAWKASMEEDVYTANSPFCVAPEEAGRPPISLEKYQALGTTEITTILTVARFQQDDGTTTNPVLFSIPLPTATREGIPGLGENLWPPPPPDRASASPHGAELGATLMPGGVKGPDPTQPIFLTVGIVSNDLRSRDPSILCAPEKILEASGFLTWDERLYRSIVVPFPPNLSLQAMAHSDTNPTTTTSGAIFSTISKTRAQAMDVGQHDMDWCPSVASLNDDDKVLILPRFLAFTGPSILPNGIIGCTSLGPSGVCTIVQSLGAKCARTAAPPADIFTTHPLLAAWLLAAQADPEDMAIPIIPYAAISTSIIEGPYSSPDARNNLFCTLFCAAYRGLRDSVLFASGECFSANFKKFEQLGQSCFTNYHAFGPAALNGHIMQLRPPPYVKLLERFFQKHWSTSPLLDDHTKSYEVMQLPPSLFQSADPDIGPYILMPATHGDASTTGGTGAESDWDDEIASPPPTQAQRRRQATKHHSATPHILHINDDDGSPTPPKRTQGGQTRARVSFSPAQSADSYHAKRRKDQIPHTTGQYHNNAPSPKTPDHQHHRTKKMRYGSQPPTPPYYQHQQHPSSHTSTTTHTTRAHTPHTYNGPYQSNLPPPPGSNAPWAPYGAPAYSNPHLPSTTSALPPANVTGYLPNAVPYYSLPKASAPPPTMAPTAMGMLPPPYFVNAPTTGSQLPPLAQHAPTTTTAPSNTHHSTTNCTPSSPSFDLNDPETFSGKNGFYSFSALLARTACTHPERQLLTSNGVLTRDEHGQYTIPTNPNTVLFPGSINDDFTQNLLTEVVQVGGDTARSTSSARDTQGTQQRAEWIIRKARNATAVLSSNSMNMLGAAPIPFDDMEVLRQCPLFVEMYRGGMRHWRPEPDVGPSANWFNAYSFLIFLPDGRDNQHPRFPRSGVSAEDILTLIRTIFFFSWLVIRSNDPQEAAIVPTSQTPVLKCIHALLTTCANLIKQTSIKQPNHSSWPTTPIEQCAATLVVLSKWNELLELFKKLVSPPILDDRQTPPNWVQCHCPFRNHNIRFPVINPHYHPSVAPRVTEFTTDNTILGALGTWRQSLRHMSFQANHLPEIPVTWLSPERNPQRNRQPGVPVSAHAPAPTAAQQPPHKSGKYSEQRHAHSDSRPIQAPSPKTSADKPILRWKIPKGPNGGRRAISGIINMCDKDKKPWLVTPEGNKLICFRYSLEGEACTPTTQSRGNKPHICKLLHIDEDHPNFNKEGFKLIDECLSTLPLSTFFEWTDFGKQFSSK
jgi:hypothetical protein